MTEQMSTKYLTELGNTSIKHDPSNCVCSSNSFFMDNRTNFPSEFPGSINQNNIFPEDIKKIPCMHACSVASVMSNSVQLYGLWLTRLLCPWDSPGKNTGVGCHFLLQTFPHYSS